MANKKSLFDRQNLTLVKDLLLDARYHVIGNLRGSAGDLEFFAGPGAVPLIALQIYHDGNGFEVWTPLVQSNRMDDTLAALRKATERPVKL